MDFLNLMLAVSEPTGMWASIIKWIQSGIGNYALTIIILTIAIKLILLPMDFYQKYITRVNTKKQAKLQPELNKLNARYANNKDLLNQKTMELYKRENYNIVGTCVGMLLNLVITMVVFFTLFAGINKMQYYTIEQEYLTLKSTYETELKTNYADTELFDENGALQWNKINEIVSDEVKAQVNNAVVEKYNEIKTSFLWIKNVWIPDNYKPVIPDYNQYLKNTNQKANEDATIEANNKLAYETVMSPLIQKYDGAWNGYMILPLLSIGVTVLSMLIPTWMEKAKAKKRGQQYVAQANMKGMLIIMPVILGIFTFFYNSVFGLYIVVGAIISLITSPLLTILSDKLEEHKAKKQPVYETASYSRKNTTPVDITKHQNKDKSKNNKQNSTITKNITNDNKTNSKKNNKK